MPDNARIAQLQQQIENDTPLMELHRRKEHGEKEVADYYAERIATCNRELDRLNGIHTSPLGWRTPESQTYDLNAFAKETPSD